jgi:hypothetical protein
MNFIKQVITSSYHDEDEQIVHFSRIDINYKITRNLKTVRSKGSFIHSGNNMYDSFISLIIPEKYWDETIQPHYTLNMQQQKDSSK